MLYGSRQYCNWESICLAAKEADGAASQYGVLRALAFRELVLLPRLAAIEEQGGKGAAASGTSAAPADAGTSAAVG